MLKRARVVTLCAVLALWAAVSWGQQVGDGAKTSGVGQKISGWNRSDSTGRIFSTDELGRIQTRDVDRDRDFPLITNFFSGLVLTAGQTFQSPTIPAGQYTRGAIMLTWAIAAADTDSVRVAVRVWGTTSLTSGNYHLWTPGGFTEAADTCNGSGYVAGDTTATSPSRCLAPLSFWVVKPFGFNRAPQMSFLAENITQGSAVKPAAGQIKVRKIPNAIVRYGSANAVMLNLTDNTGAPCPFPYIVLQVTNAGRQSLTSVEANLWPRVQ